MGIPTKVSLSLTSGPRTTISWDAVAGASGYNIYRGSGNPDTPWAITYSKLNSVLVTGTSYTDSAISSGSTGSTYFYYVRAVDSGGTESDNSIVVRTQPRITIEGYVSVNSASSQTITWSPVSNAVSYNIYRAPTTVTLYPLNEVLPSDSRDASYPRYTVKYADPGTFTKINTQPVTGTTYNDNIDLYQGGSFPYKVYAYKVKAVNMLGVEAGESPHWLTIPSAPTNLKWRENWTANSGRIDLKWSPNPEAGISGYRVYFYPQDSAAPVVERTTNIITSTSYTDTLTSGASSNKNIGYYVTAVNVLDQEGIPSARALVNRNDKGAYDSFGYLNDYYISGVLINYFDLPTAIAGSAYSQSLSASGGTQPYTWSIASGSLPPGLSLTQSGTISGIPTTSGQYSFTVMVRDSSSPQEQDTMPYLINAVPQGTDIDPPVITNIASSSITTTSATISWQTNEPATSQVEYGTSTGYGSQTTKDTNLLTTHTVQLSGLSPNTLYHYRAISQDQAGNTRTSPDNTFTTANPSAPPSVTVAANPTAGVIPLTVSFTSSVTSANPIASYQWSFGDGGTSSQPNPQHTYTTIGFYTATLTVTDTSSLQGQGSASIDAYSSNDSLRVRILTPATADLSTLYNWVSYRPEPGWSSHQITYVPPKYLNNLTLIRLSFNDQSISSPSYLSFTISKRATVYVAYDGDATPPNWLTSSFTNTGDQLQITEGFGSMTIWSKVFDSGTVTLGGNAAAGASGYNNMYTVFLEGAQSQYHRADTNQDCVITLPEITGFISLWHQDSTAYPMRELMDGIGKWKAGAGCA